ncbi:phenazine biosynthesis protein PhzE [Dactylosporangium fulvum]|uniref:anthranilate synthase n=1 Tax=Dactylosporangium fulvum TaxID=53359 RepID=A0ABY5WBR9_9ACTN|nr:anthranilate synthase family protein [Dactylosporangium fulvum]UWP87517.1 anthranilate synthase family protein [Dactylosporangium fulvum]
MEPFALLHRPSSVDGVEILSGPLSTAATLAELPPAPVLVVVPFRQVAERGYECVDDGAPLLALRVATRSVLPVGLVAGLLPDLPIPLSGSGFGADDYESSVRRIVDEEIGAGEGANFVIRRVFRASIDGYELAHALAFFRRLLVGESGAYWTFLIHTGDRTFVGATPERHISVRAGEAVMNPISGTFRYGPSGPTVPGVLGFLADRKETDELAMVLDEELKMMARICPEGGRVDGPYLRQMTRLAHTEYFVRGRTSLDPREILRETLFAPTVTGSPLENACRVIARHERQGRGYYSGVAALIDQDELDSAILIRTAEIDRGGRLSIGVGATLVRHSDPAAEAAETEAKASALLAALRGTASSAAAAPAPDLTADGRIRSALAGRNTGLAGFWLTGAAERPVSALAGRRVLVVDAEDTFTRMLSLQLGSLGLAVTVRRYDEPYALDAHDLVVLGPGPGDPRDGSHPKIAHLRSAVDSLLAGARPLLAVCLSHQVLSARLGLRLARRPVPNQGLQRRVDLFGRPELVGFYNTFAAYSDEDKVELPGDGVVELSRDPATGEVHALRGPTFASMQFHPESVLTHHGVRVVAGLITPLLGG